jgi:DNA-binding response OmpR family regulator
MRVLIVEDDPRLAAALSRGLEEAGIGVVHAPDGQQAIAAGLATSFDAIILDVMLPGGADGFDVASTLRNREVATPILMLTGRDSIEDRVRGLDAGADDYLLKPFAFEELLARVRALARRHLPARSSVLRLGAITLDTARWTAKVGETAVRLTSQELLVLEYFLLHPGQVLSRAQLMEHAWADGAEEAGESNVVEVYVGRVRRMLVAAGSPDPFVTVRGAGYRMELPES